jgi:hypothetical protein
VQVCCSARAWHTACVSLANHGAAPEQYFVLCSTSLQLTAPTVSVYLHWPRIRLLQHGQLRIKEGLPANEKRPPTAFTVRVQLWLCVQLWYVRHTMLRPCYCRVRATVGHVASVTM